MAHYLLTDSTSATQQAGRAFAAEALAPAEGIRELLNGGGENASDDAIAIVADRFGVGDMVIRYQIDNQIATS